MRKTRFESVGLYTPAKTILSGELAQRLKKKLVRYLEMMGIRERRYRSDTEDSYGLSLKAARSCLDRSEWKVEDLDAVVYTGITRFKDGIKQCYEPAISLHIKRELGAHRAINFDISNACAGMLTGAFVLDNLIRAGVVRNGMIVSGECITPIFDTAVKEVKEVSDDQFASLTLGDAGAAFILDGKAGSEEGIDFVHFATFAQFADLCIAKPSRKNSGWAMYTQAAALQDETIRRFPGFLQQVLEKHGKDLVKDYDFAIPHQTSVRAIRIGSRKWSAFFKSRIPETLVSVDNFGNTASTSHFLVLCKHLEDKKIGKGSRVLFLGLASGITIGFLSATVGELSYGDDHTRSLVQHER